MSITVPPFRIDHVGSLARPQALLDAFNMMEDGNLSRAEFWQVAERHIGDAVGMQEEAGLFATTDGENRPDAGNRAEHLGNDWQAMSAHGLRG